MKPTKLNVALGALLLAAGCSQILGLGDYEVDPALDGPSSGGTTAGGEGGGGQGDGGTPNGAAGEGGAPGDGGDPGVGGVPGNGGTPGSAGEGGAPPLGELVPCDSAACCTAALGLPVGVELLQDGGFEDGPVGDQLTVWTQFSTNDFEAIMTAGLGWEPRTGEYFAYLSGYPGETTYLWSEDVLVPGDAGWLELTGYRNFQIDTEDGVNADFAAVTFFSYDDSADEYLFFWTTPGGGSDGWGETLSWTRFSASWSAEPHRGEIRYLALAGESDEYSTNASRDSSSYLFDDLSLKAFRCYR